MGGLSKKAYQLSNLRRDNKLPSLALDAGCLLFKREQLAPGRQDVDKITARAIIDAYNIMGYAAIAVGPRDLAAGMDFLQEIRKRANFPLLSANIVRKSNRQPIFKQATTSKVGNLKIGIIGLTGKGSIDPLHLADKAIILSWQETLPEQIERIKKHSDLIILLSSLTPQENKQIAAEYPVHLIIQSGPRTSNINPISANNTLICQTASQGKYLGSMKIAWSASKQWQSGITTEIENMKLELERVNNQLRMHPNNVTLAARKEQLTIRLQQMKIEQADRNRRHGKPATYQNTFIAVDASLPDQPEVKKIVQEMKKEINESGRKSAMNAQQQKSLRANSPGSTESPQTLLQYTGWSACATCHARQAAAWKNSPHARAYQTLVEQKQHFNARCIACHVTGIKSGGDRAAFSLPGDLRQVGCEACHGPGRKHVESPTTSHLAGMPNETTCRICHSIERDRTFQYRHDVKLLNCPPA